MDTVTAVKPRVAAASPAKTALGRDELLKLIASDIATHSMRNLGGIDRIEHRPDAEIDALPVDATVFGVIADSLTGLGIETDRTVGGVMEALGFTRLSESAHHYAHEIGCGCHGEFISPSIASQRILNLIGKQAW
jgi:hypothetical protein